MNSESALISFDHSEKVKVSSRPCVVFNAKGDSYVNKKAAGLLELKHLDCLRFFRQGEKVYLSNNELGATVRHERGLFRFCDTKAVKQLFQFLSVDARKVTFILLSQIETIEDPNTGEIHKVLMIIPKPLNVEI